MDRKKVAVENRLFWFFKEGVQLDLADPAMLDLYVQQVVTHGRTEDVRGLLKEVEPDRFSSSLQRLGRFLPREVRMFWEDFLGSRH